MLRLVLPLMVLLFFPALSAGQEQPVIPAQPEMNQLKALYKRDNEIPYPPTNKYTDAKYILGKKLFFDPRLSDSDVISCASCHNPGFSWVDGLSNAKGKAHKSLPRKTMSLLNLAWDKVYLWDARADSFEAQVEEALTASEGMSNDFPELVKKIHSIPGYRDLFKKAFADEDKKYAENDFINIHSITAAITTFERGIVSGKAPFDEWVEGKETAISESAKRGFVLFNTKATCSKCHTGWRFSDGKYYNVGVKEKEGVTDLGRGSTAPRDLSLYFKFKAVGLRNISERSPYMHNGSLNTLEEVVDMYNRGGNIRVSGIDVEPLNLSDGEKADLVEFLKTLTSEDPGVTIPALPR